MLLNAGPVKFHNNTRLDVELIPGTDPGRRLRVSAIVTTRRNGQGVGLTFLSLDSESINSLCKILSDLPLQSVESPAVQYG
jgi:hypothetical protein